MAGRQPPNRAPGGPQTAQEPAPGPAQQYVVDDTTPKTINSIQFSMMDPQQMSRAAEVRIYNRELYQHMSRNPYPAGPLDPKLGTSLKKGTCLTCGESVDNCPGHFGVIHLALPVFHIGYIKQILSVLRMICKTCSRILLTDSEMALFRKSVRSKKNFDMSRRKEVQKRIIKECQKKGICPRCQAGNGEVKKAKGSHFKFFHTGFKGKEKDGRKASWVAQFDDAVKINPEIEVGLKNVRFSRFPRFNQLRNRFYLIKFLHLLLISSFFSLPQLTISTL